MRISSAAVRANAVQALLAGLALGLPCGVCSAGDEILIDAMEDLSRWHVFTREQTPPVEIAADPNPHEGRSAMRVDVKTRKTTAILYTSVRPTPSWNRFDGISFRVKGDGSDNHACVMLQAGAWDKAWVGTFPLTNTAWHEVRMAWNDLVPVALLTPELGTAAGYRPSDFDEVVFGKRCALSTRHTSPPFSFSLDALRLVKGLKTSRRRVKVNELPPLAGVIEKLKARRPVCILALGDSITWGSATGGNHTAYPAYLGRMLAKRYRSSKVRVINRAIGGSTTFKARQWLNRDIRGIEADLVTVMFGYNEKPAAGQGEKYAQAFGANLVRYVEEVAGVMKKPPACIFLATMPGRREHWETLDPYAGAVRALGRAHRNLVVADLHGRFKRLGVEAYASLMKDEAHPNERGQREIARALFRILTGEPFED